MTEDLDLQLYRPPAPSGRASNPSWPLLLVALVCFPIIIGLAYDRDRLREKNRQLTEQLANSQPTCPPPPAFHQGPAAWHLHIARGAR